MEPNNFPREVIGKMSPMVGDGATFPEKLIRPFILATSKENDLVLDPFIGSGTTAKVSLENGRKCVGYDISPVFVDTSYQRCGQVKVIRI